MKTTIRTILSVLFFLGAFQLSAQSGGATIRREQEAYRTQQKYLEDEKRKTWPVNWVGVAGFSSDSRYGASLGIALKRIGTTAVGVHLGFITKQEKDIPDSGAYANEAPNTKTTVKSSSGMQGGLWYDTGFVIVGAGYEAVTNTNQTRTVLADRRVVTTPEFDMKEKGAYGLLGIHSKRFGLIASFGAASKVGLTLSVRF